VAYAPTTDFLALLRTLPDGTARLASIPGLDWAVAVLARAGAISVWVHPDSGPTKNASKTVWLKASSTSWATEGTVYLWDFVSQSYQPATPALWSALFVAVASTVKQTDPVTSQVLTTDQAGGLFTNAGSVTIQYTLPVASDCPGATFEFAVTQSGALNIAVANNGQSNADTVRFGLTTTKIGINSAYLGSYLKVRSISGQWFVIGSEGTWTLT
jgi:hypothetical protein